MLLVGLTGTPVGRYDVARILDARVRKRKRLGDSKEHFVRWEGLPDEEAEWVQERNAVGCSDLIKEFELRRQGAKPEEPSEDPEQRLTLQPVQGDALVAVQDGSGDSTGVAPAGVATVTSN